MCSLTLQPTGERLQEFTARNISNTVYALAVMQINPGDALLTALAAEAVKKISGFIAQNLSNTIWYDSTLSTGTEGCHTVVPARNVYSPFRTASAPSACA